VGWERALEAIVGFFTHPIVLLLASLLVFLAVAWAALPFALYGVRRRLDRIAEGLERIQKALEAAGEARRSAAQAPAPSGREPAPAEERAAAGALFVELRKELMQLAPALEERVLDPSNVVFLHRREAGGETPCLSLAVERGRVRATFPLNSLREAYPRFSAERFREYAEAFLPERHGYFAAASPDGGELHLTIEPRSGRPLDIFVGIVREQLLERIRGGSA